MIIGAHISKKKTLLLTIQDILSHKGNALQFFSKNPRSLQPVEPSSYNLNIPEDFHLVIHSSYLINLATSLQIDKRTYEIQDMPWFKSIIADLELAHKLNIHGVVVHVGKHTKLSLDDGLINMKNSVNCVIQYIKKNKLKSKLILETASGQGTELLVNIEDLIKFYNDIGEYDCFKICFDTCHVWSAGFDINEAFLKIQNGTKNAISTIHLNGSSTPKNSRKDRHSTIYEGSIPFDTIKTFMKIFQKYKDIILIIETPSIQLTKEIDELKNM
tara:strand:- start:3089 stop:3904 length:816 start_codon:yes stop_codon:yes gene_type:complete